MNRSRLRQHTDDRVAGELLSDDIRIGPQARPAIVGRQPSVGVTVVVIVGKETAKMRFEAEHRKIIRRDGSRDDFHVAGTEFRVDGDGDRAGRRRDIGEDVILGAEVLVVGVRDERCLR